MNRMTRLGAILLSATMLCTSLVGCASTESSEATATTTVTESGTDLSAISDFYVELAGISGDTVVGTAKDVEVTADQLLCAAATVCDQITYTYQSYYGTTDIPWDEDMGEGQTWAEYLLESAVITAGLYAVIPSIAGDLGIEATQEILDMATDEIEAVKAELTVDMNTEYLFWQVAATEDSYYDLTVIIYLYDELMAYYQENGIDGYPSYDDLLAYAVELGEYSAKHILFMTIDTSTYEALSDEESAEKRALAEDVLAQLRASDDPVALFDDLMNEYSEDARDPSTGALYSPDGYVAYAGQMVTEFEETATALEDYEISDIVETTYGYHIIMALPYEMDLESYRATLIEEQVYAMQTRWTEVFPVETTEAYDQIDIESFYANLNQIRSDIELLVQELDTEG